MSITRQFAAHPTSREHIRIRPGAMRRSSLSQVWKARYLLWMFVWRDVKVRYKQTLLGAGWALLQPLLAMLVFTLVFSRVARIPSEHVPYPVFVLSGLLPWQFFSYGLVRSSNSLVESRYLLTKVAVPRLILPVSAVLSGVPEFAVALGLLLCVMAYYRITPSVYALLLLPLIVVVAIASLSVGLFLAALNVRYRDVAYVIPFFTQLLFFLTPVAYPASLVPPRWEFLYRFNPIAGVIGAFRFVLLRQGDGLEVGGALISLTVLLMVSYLYFRSSESTFADVV